MLWMVLCIGKESKVAKCLCIAHKLMNEKPSGGKGAHSRDLHMMHVNCTLI